MAEVSINEYLITQLNKLGIDDFFAVPGDFNFDILDTVENNPNTRLIGCTNELNAGYSADGYARAKGYGAVITTFGVGELSAINAIAGSFAESVPVISIVGAPSTKMAHNNAIIHHNFSKPDYYAFKKAFSNVTQKAVYLGIENAKEEIDELLSLFIKNKKPVYIAIPNDVGNHKVDDGTDIKNFKSSESNLISASKHACGLINSAKNPIIIVGVLVERFFAKEELINFIKESNIATTTLLMGKGTVDEELPNFIGTYLGSLDNPEVYDMVNKSDCVISIGTIYSDFNTLGNDITFNSKDFIEIQGTSATIENENYKDIKMADLLLELTRQVKRREKTYTKSLPDLSYDEVSEDEELSFKYLAPKFQQFLRPNDKLVADMGILDFFVPALSFAHNVNWYSQILWASIGWATPAIFGAMIAEPDTRHILLTGEGSHQISIQALSDIIRHNLKPVIFVLNNKGYTIERMISKDPCDKYNDIAMWDYTKIARSFSEDIYSASVRTNCELDEVFKEIEKNSDKLCYIELRTRMFDLPCLFKKMRERVNSLNEKM